MGHKVHPIGFRLGIIKDWQSRWFAEKNYTKLLAEDFRLRTLIKTKLANASISKVEIERAAANQVAVTIHTAKPGIVIGKSGQAVEELRQTLEKETKKKVRLNIHEIRQPELDAYLVAKSVAEQLEKRISFRRALKQSVQRTMRMGAKGIKIIVGGRLGGAEIARTEKEVEGKVPLHTLRADIDYANAEAHTTFGVIGIKVWIYRGEVLPGKRRSDGSMPTAEIASPAQQPMRSNEDRRPSAGHGAPAGQRRPRRENTPVGQGGYTGGGGSYSAGGRPPRPPRREGAPGGARPPRPEGGRAPSQVQQQRPAVPATPATNGAQEAAPQPSTGTELHD